MPYVWNGRKAHRRSGSDGDTFVEVGEEFTPSDAELQAYPDLIQEIPGSTSTSSEDEEDEEEEPEGDFKARKFVERHFRKVTSDLSTGAYDDWLDEIEDVERGRDTGARDSVVSAIEDRREE